MFLFPSSFNHALVRNSGKLIWKKNLDIFINIVSTTRERKKNEDAFSIISPNFDVDVFVINYSMRLKRICRLSSMGFSIPCSCRKCRENGIEWMGKRCPKRWLTSPFFIGRFAIVIRFIRSSTNLSSTSWQIGEVHFGEDVCQFSINFALVENWRWEWNQLRRRRWRQGVEREEAKKMESLPWNRSNFQMAVFALVYLFGETRSWSVPFSKFSIPCSCIKNRKKERKEKTKEKRK